MLKTKFYFVVDCLLFFILIKWKRVSNIDIWLLQQIQVDAKNKYPSYCRITFNNYAQTYGYKYVKVNESHVLYEFTCKVYPQEWQNIKVILRKKIFDHEISKPLSATTRIGTIHLLSFLEHVFSFTKVINAAYGPYLLRRFKIS